MFNNFIVRPKSYWLNSIRNKKFNFGNSLNLFSCESNTCSSKLSVCGDCCALAFVCEKAILSDHFFFTFVKCYRISRNLFFLVILRNGMIIMILLLFSWNKYTDSSKSQFSCKIITRFVLHQVLSTSSCVFRMLQAAKFVF